MTGPIRGDQEANSIHSLSGNHGGDSEELEENQLPISVMQGIYSDGLRFGFVLITEDGITEKKVECLRSFQERAADSLQLHC